MTPIKRFWLDILDGRRHAIQTVYGHDAMRRYRPHPMEKDYFIQNNGHFTQHPEVLDYNDRFFAMCDELYAHKKAAFHGRIDANMKKVEQTTEYKNRKRERDELFAYIRGINLSDGKDSQEENFNQSL